MSQRQSESLPYDVVAIAAGISAPGIVRITLSLQPNRNTSVDELQTWPSIQTLLLSNGGIRIFVAPGSELSPKSGAFIDTNPKWPIHSGPGLDRVNHLWKRVMNPCGDIYPAGQSPWDDLHTILNEQSPAQPVAVVAPPHGAVALAYTLERGRLLAEAIDVLPQRRTSLSVSSNMPLQQRLHPNAWPTAYEFAKDAAGLVPLHPTVLSQIVQAHADATPGASSTTSKATVASNTPPSTPQLQTAQQRLGALASSPTLQRLFGFAVDVTISADRLRALLGSSGLIWIAVDMRCWTLARIDFDEPSGIIFCPANLGEGEVATGSSWRGLRNLGEMTAENEPRYDLCTIDPTLAVAQVRAAGLDESLSNSSSVTDLHNGGLRLLDGQAVSALKKQLDEDRKNQTNANSTDGMVLLTADTLAVSDRLMIGLKTKYGLAWRSTQYRHVTYEDPEPPTAWSPDWIEEELATRGLGRRTARRMELDAAELHQPLIDDANNPKVSKYDGTIAAWGGEPMGVTPAAHDRGKTESVEVIQVVGELDITRRYAAPLAHDGDSPSYLSPLLRFGWSYYTALIRVFPSGVSATLQEAARIILSDDKRSVALPSPASSAGRRFLRHERLHSPTSAVAYADRNLLNIRKFGKAHNGDTIVLRTSNAYPETNISNARRVLIAAPVPLFFAALHGVLDQARSDQPPQGIPAAVLLSESRQDPTLLQITGLRHDRDPSFYPDPAATYMAMRLSGTAGTVNWAEEPLIIKIGQIWPETLSVHVEIRRTLELGKTRIEQVSGRRWLAEGEILVENQPSLGTSIEVAAVEIYLSPGEIMQLDVWSFPSATQLATWFDAVESASIVQAVIEAFPPDASPVIANADNEIVQTSDQCNCGPGGLTVPDASNVAALANLVFSILQAKPIFSLVAVKCLQLVHAVDASVFRHPVLPTDPVLVRRLFPGGEGGTDPTQESRLQFINAVVPSDWNNGYDEQGATSILLSGSIQVDLASTVGVRVVASCPSPRSDNLDQMRGRTSQQIRNESWQGIDLNNYNLFGFRLEHDHRVTFNSEQVTLLEIDGLPLPMFGTKALQTFRLEELQAAAWGTAKPFGDALRAVVPGALATTGARKLEISIFAVNRHASLLEANDALAYSGSKEAWLPSTKRPAPPVVDHTQLAQKLTYTTLAAGGDDTFTKKLERTTVIRIWLSRPWWSSGQGEKLGVVLWPPGLFASGIDEGPLDEPVCIPDFADEDIGPGGKYITRWGADAYRDGPIPKGPLIPSQNLILTNGENVSNAFMPLLTQGSSAPTSSNSSQSSGGNDANGERQGQPLMDFLEVALLVAEPRFDPRDELFYVDLEIDTELYPMPHVRLGLVRFQQNAREDRQFSLDQMPVRLRVSSPVTEWVQPLPKRTLTATCQMSRNATTVTVAISGPWASYLDGDLSKMPHGKPAIEMEIVRHRTASTNFPTAEETVWDEATSTYLCSWEGDGIVSEPFEGGIAWVGLFTLSERLDTSLWTYAVVVRETELMRTAADLGTEAYTVPSGPKFFARLELKRK